MCSNLSKSFRHIMKKKKRISDDKSMDSKTRTDANKQTEETKKNAIINLVDQAVNECILRSYDRHYNLFE